MGNHWPLTVLPPHIQLNPRLTDSTICRLYHSWIKQGLHCSRLWLHRNTFSLSDESDRSLTHKKCTKSGMQFKEFTSLQETFQGRGTLSWDRLGPGTLCCNVCTWTNASLSNKIWRNYMELKITVCIHAQMSWRKSYDKPRQHIKEQRNGFADKGPYSQSSDSSSSHVYMWQLDHKECWVLKNWSFWIVVLEKTLENIPDSKEIKPVNLKGNQTWIFTGRTDVGIPVL